MKIIEVMKERIRLKGMRLVFVEGWDERMILAASELREKGILRPILIGEEKKIRNKASELNIDLKNTKIINPEEDDEFDEILEKFLEIRKGKIEKEEGIRLLKQPNYYGTMLVKLGKADCLIGGVEYSTADTIRPALQIIKTKETSKKVSSAFLMYKEENKSFIFGDCAINIQPTEEDLVDIAKHCCDLSKVLELEEPKVAFLSFSSKGSGKGEMVDRVRNAADTFKQKYPEIISEGEIQFDAALVEEVARKKIKNSSIKGDANILIFPSLEAGNIGYKIAQRLGRYEAIGPIILGLNSPINDLSRGASKEDVYNISIITAALAYYEINE